MAATVLPNIHLLSRPGRRRRTRYSSDAETSEAGVTLSLAARWNSHHTQSLSPAVSPPYTCFYFTFAGPASEQQLERNNKPFFAQIRLSLRHDWLSDGRLRRLATCFAQKGMHEVMETDTHSVTVCCACVIIMDGYLGGLKCECEFNVK